MQSLLFLATMNENEMPESAVNTSERKMEYLAFKSLDKGDYDFYSKDVKRNLYIAKDH